MESWLLPNLLARQASTRGGVNVVGASSHNTRQNTSISKGGMLVHIGVKYIWRTVKMRSGNSNRPCPCYVSFENLIELPRHSAIYLTFPVIHSSYRDRAFLLLSKTLDNDCRFSIFRECLQYILYLGRVAIGGHQSCQSRRWWEAYDCLVVLA